MSRLRHILEALLGVLVAASFAYPWATLPVARAITGVGLGLGWIGALVLAIAATQEARRCHDQPYFSTACWFGWSALTVALVGPAFQLPALPLTLLVLTGWAGSAVGLWLDLGREWPPSPGLLSQKEVAKLVLDELGRPTDS